jgi:quinol monooxygenase YgiN
MSSEHKVVVAVAVARQGQETSLAKRLEEVAKASWAEEGVLRYAVHALQDSPGSFMMVEVYSSESAFEAHLATDHVVALIADLPTLVEGDLTVYQGVAEPYSSEPKGMV